MATTAKQDRNFLDEVVGSGLLENAIEWIGQNLEPEQGAGRDDIRLRHREGHVWDDNSAFACVSQASGTSGIPQSLRGLPAVCHG